MDEKTAGMTPAQRMTAGLCPECGQDLAGLDVLSHRDGHWRPDRYNQFGPDAKIRFDMVTNYVKGQVA